MRLADFGCAVGGPLGDLRSVESALRRGHPEFLPPEDPNFSELSDVYQLGLTILCLATLQRFPDRIYEPRGYSERILNVLAECMESDPRDRPGSDALPDKLHRQRRKVEPLPGGRLHIR